MTRLRVIIVVAGAIAISAVLFSLTLVCTVGSGKTSRKSDCKNSLKQIGVYFALYESRYKKYPTVGGDTWFSLLWQQDMATDGNLFRCKVRGLEGSGTHFRGIIGPGAFTPVGGVMYQWTAAGITDGAPPDLPIACDGDVNGVPNHGAGDDRNVLFFQGRADVFAVGSPTEVAVIGLLKPMTWSAPAGTK